MITPRENLLNKYGQVDEGGQVGEEHEQLGHVTVLR